MAVAVVSGQWWSVVGGEPSIITLRNSGVSESSSFSGCWGVQKTEGGGILLHSTAVIVIVAMVDPN